MHCWMKLYPVKAYRRELHLNKWMHQSFTRLAKYSRKNGFHVLRRSRPFFADILLILWSFTCIHWSKWSSVKWSKMKIKSRCASAGCSFIQQLLQIRPVDGKLDRTLVMTISIAGHRTYILRDAAMHDCPLWFKVGIVDSSQPHIALLIATYN